jgi:hypothetical protein
MESLSSINSKTNVWDTVFPAFIEHNSHSLWRPFYNIFQTKLTTNDIQFRSASQWKEVYIVCALDILYSFCKVEKNFPPE